MKKFIIVLLFFFSFILGVVLSDDVIEGLNKVLGSHIVTRKTLTTELEEARNFFNIYKKKYFELKEQIESGRRD